MVLITLPQGPLAIASLTTMVRYQQQHPQAAVLMAREELLMQYLSMILKVRSYTTCFRAACDKSSGEKKKKQTQKLRFSTF